MSKNTFENFDPSTVSDEKVYRFCISTKSWIAYNKPKPPENCATDEELKAELTTAREAIAVLEEQVQKSEDELSSAMATIEANKDRLDAVQDELSSAMTTIEVKDEKIKELEAEVERLKAVTPESIIRAQGVAVNNLAGERVFYGLTNDGQPITNLNGDSVSNVVV